MPNPPDLRTQLTDALQTFPGLCALGEPYGQSIVQALLSLPGIAIVSVPEQMDERSVVAGSLRDRPMWAVNDAWTCITDEGEIELEADGQMLCGSLKSAQDARDLAAALLAAAAEADHA